MNRMCRPLVFVLLFAAVLLPRGSGAGLRPEEVLVGVAERFDPVPWAGNRYASAVLTAPAWLSLEDRPEVLYGRLDMDGLLDGETVLCIRSKSFGFATESFHWTEERKLRRYVFALSRRINRDLAVGVSYAWHVSKDEELDELSSWDGSVAWTPHWRVELSGAGRNLMRTDFGPLELGRIYEAGARFIVWDRRLNGFVQARRFAGDDAGEIVPIFGAELFPRRYVTLRGRADTDGHQGLGIELRFDTASIGFHYQFSDGEEDGVFAYARLHTPRGK